MRLYPIVWLLLLPLRLVGIVVDGVFEFLAALVRLPAARAGVQAVGSIVDVLSESTPVSEAAGSGSEQR